MTRGIILIITSLLSILFLTLHISDEIARGTEHGGLNMIAPVLVLAGSLSGTLVLAGRRSGYIIMLIVAVFGTGIPILHMSGSAGLVGGKIAADSSGAFFWAWQNITLCTVSACSLILAVLCIWDPEWGNRKISDSKPEENDE